MHCIRGRKTIAADHSGLYQALHFLMTDPRRAADWLTLAPKEQLLRIVMFHRECLRRLQRPHNLLTKDSNALNWTMIGHGDSSTEAYETLEKNNPARFHLMANLASLCLAWGELKAGSAYWYENSFACTCTDNPFQSNWGSSLRDSFACDLFAYELFDKLKGDPKLLGVLPGSD